MVLSVSQINAEARQLLEDHFSLIWVEGEISNLSIPTSGHIYFSLKDSTAQIRCAFFKGKNKFLPFNLENGMQLLVQAKVSLYEGRGEFQLIIQQIELAGAGLLRRQFELLKAKLMQENLFSDIYKKEIPKTPNTIGIITSSTGAALHDILSTLKRRAPFINIIIYPCQVQGTTAASYIIEALKQANSRNEVEAIILARGGGSLEDLWCFNDETLAREIFKSKIPIVTGIGHEVDFTIADFVADVRAATPTAAAELISPNQAIWFEELNKKEVQLSQYMRHKIELVRLELLSLTNRLRHPGHIIRERMQSIDFIEQRLFELIQKIIKLNQTSLTELKIHLKHVNPEKMIQNKLIELKQLFSRLNELIQQKIKTHSVTLQHIAQTLNNLSPLIILERGYAIPRDPVTKKVIASIQTLKINQSVEFKFVDGDAECEVKKLFPRLDSTCKKNKKTNHHCH